MAASAGCWENPSAPPVPAGRIAYAATRGGVQGLNMASSEGTQTVPLTASGEDKPAWDPRGELIAFQRANRGTYTDIWILVPGGEAVQVTDTPGANERDPTWSPFGERIAYSATFFTEGVAIADSIVVSTPDGRGRTAITPGLDPSWGPGGQIAFVDGVAGAGTRPTIWVLSVDGSRLPVTAPPSGTVAEIEPAWSSTGRLAWTRRRLITRTDGTTRDEWAIMVQPSSGAEAVAVATDSVVVRAPTWSPEGTHLMITAEWGRRTEVWAMRADGSERRRITSAARCDAPPCSDANASWTR